MNPAGSPPEGIALDGAAIHLWRADLGDFDGLERAAARWLTPAERRRGGRRHLAGRLLIRAVLSRYHPEVAPEDWRFVLGPRGRPAAAGPLEPGAAPRFSLSHSGSLLALAASRLPAVGVDIETGGRARPVERIARRCFSEAERAELAALPAAERPGRFLALWTLKEACAKARGGGLSAPLRQAVFLFEGERGLRLAGPLWTGGRWRCWLLEEAPYLALAARGPGPAAPPIRSFRARGLGGWRETPTAVARAGVADAPGTSLCVR